MPKTRYYILGRSSISPNWGVEKLKFDFLLNNSADGIDLSGSDPVHCTIVHNIEKKKMVGTKNSTRITHIWEMKMIPNAQTILWNSFYFSFSLIHHTHITHRLSVFFILRVNRSHVQTWVVNACVCGVCVTAAIEWSANLMQSTRAWNRFSPPARQAGIPSN